MGGGVSFGDQPWMANVRALACDGQKLHVAGAFDLVGSGGSIAASSIAAFDLASESWQALDAGLVNLGAPGEGRALALSVSTLYVGGYFDTAGPLPTPSLASLDTTTGAWTAYGAGIRDGDFTGQVESLALDPGTGTVYVGGSFTYADTVPTSGLAALNGTTFTSIGAFALVGSPNTASVKALAVSEGKVYAGGEFTTAGNAAASNWACYDGTSWSVPGDGVDNVIRALAPIDAGVVVGGDFVASGSLRMPYGGIWTGTGWETFGQGLSYDPYADANVYALAAVDAGAYVGGYFDQAGSRPVGSVAWWTGTVWEPMAGGVKAASGLGTVYAMVRIGTDLYVAGSFATAGGGVAANIARWDGTAWSALGSGLNDTAYALAILGGKLYVGGRFSAAGAVAASGVAVWDPATGAWSGLGNAPLYDDAVQGLAAIGDRYLVIGGQYGAFRVGGVDFVRGLNGMTMFDTHAQIAPDAPVSGYYLVAGVQQSRGIGTVRALTVLGNDLYIGGTFDTAGVLAAATPPTAGFSAQNLAVWHFGTDGSWSSPGGADQRVQALSTLGGTQLLLGGWFRSAGPVAASGVARYDPAAGTWAACGSGIDGQARGVMHVEALAQSSASGLWVGGTFTTAGGRPSGSIALWTATVGQAP